MVDKANMELVIYMGVGGCVAWPILPHQHTEFRVFLDDTCLGCDNVDVSRITWASRVSAWNADDFGPSASSSLRSHPVFTAVSFVLFIDIQDSDNWSLVCVRFFSA